ncbi:kinase [Ferrovibrio sp.]|uniref:GHMP family kinase ATP-binding protein n=1 Tax=Ferrovibrio sp. TaxID=1917215 RepID=UPI003D0F46D8
MIITSRTPLRVSFFGGGTDYPEYFQRRHGAVVGMAIDQYIYITAVPLSPIVEYKYRISYSKLEFVTDTASIAHPVIRKAFEHYEFDQPLDISIISDVPASTGLGSSSAFTVGLLNLISALRKQPLTKFELAKRAIFVERELLRENVGVQDQLHAAYGGINRFDFEAGRIRLSPVQMAGRCQERLIDSMVLIYTGIVRHASATVAEQISSTVEKKIDTELGHLLALTDTAVNLLESDSEDHIVEEFGRLLHEGWLVKRQLSSRISNSNIDELYERARLHGACGGKLLGAGGGGFLLLIVPPERQSAFLAAMGNVKHRKIKLDTQGSVII